MLYNYPARVIVVISRSAIKYIENKATNANIRLSENYLDVLKEYCGVVKSFGYKLSFRKGRGNNPEVLGCNSGYTKYMSIVATPEWAATIVLDASAESRNAFLMTLGHELTHKEGDFNPLIGFLVSILCLTNPISGLRFVAHVNEIHADFGAVEKFAKDDKEKQIAAMQYKTKRKNERDKDTIAHPSWKHRIEYIEKYNFDKNLIKKIAKRSGCKCQKLIALVAKYYNV